MVSAEARKEGDLRSNAAHGGVPLRFASGIINTGAIGVLNSGKMSVPYAKLFEAIINEDLPLSS